MPADVESAERFIFANARLLDRHRLVALRHGAAVKPVLDTLRAYRNPDGGFGNALEPDVRGPETEPFVTPACAAYPHAPWMVPSDGGSHLTFAIAGLLWEAGSSEPWLQRATEWCWAKLERSDELGAYFVKFALDFLDTVPDGARARATLEHLRSRIDNDGSMAVAGGTENERLTPLTLSPRPLTRSRALFTEAQIEADLQQLEQAQQLDGGWAFDWLASSPGQSAEWRGALTLRALATLSAHGQIADKENGP